MFFKVFKINYKLIICLVFLFSISLVLFYNVTANSNTDVVEVPIIMYHSILKDTSKSGKYIITPSQLENDLVYLSENHFSPIFIQDLINYVYDKKELPENPIILTFDDGYYNNYEYVLPLLKKYDFKAVISIVGKYTDNYTQTNETNPNYSYMRWSDIQLAIDSGYIEFQNHSYNLHSNIGSSKKYKEDFESYKNRFSSDVLKLQEEFKVNTSYIPTTYTYPFGKMTNGTTNILKDLGFKASLSCTSGMNYISSDIDCLFGLKRYNRPSNISTKTFFNNILKNK